MADQWQSRIVGTGEEQPDQLLANPMNWRVHPKRQQDALGAVLDRVGWVQQVIVNRTTGHLVDGHLRVALALSRREERIPVVYVEISPEEEAVVLATLDPLSAMAGEDRDILADLLEGMDDADRALAALTDEPGTPPRPDAPSLVDRFVVPPFSVLDQRAGYWQQRKDQWMGLGIRSEEGRGGDLLGLATEGLAEAWKPKERALALGTPAAYVPDYYAQKNAAQDRIGRPLSREEFERDYLVIPEGQKGNLSTTGTSVFDPVLCEIAYRWFSPPGSTVLDPFAGGSVRGITAAALGRAYTGVDLSGPQVLANEDQWVEIGPRLGDVPRPQWIRGDSTLLEDLLPSGYAADMIFSCPPYADLERYSDDPRDISNMDYEDFLRAYREIIAHAVARLREDRFIVWVVGEIRGPKHSGAYRGFVPDTITAFADAGAHFYNEGILISPVGSLAVRAGRYFSTTRKLGKSHQQVLVFVKGDPRAATEACGTVDVEVQDEATAAAGSGPLE